jgi:hypothetical protein
MKFKKRLKSLFKKKEWKSNSWFKKKRNEKVIDLKKKEWKSNSLFKKNNKVIFHIFFKVMIKSDNIL